MRRNIFAASALLFWSTALTASAAAQQPVKLGVLNDQTGLYSDLSGMGSVHAARMAVEDFGGKVLGRPIEIIFADHQNKPDIGANIARQWIEQVLPREESTPGKPSPCAAWGDPRGEA